MFVVGKARIFVAIGGADVAVDARVGAAVGIKVAVFVAFGVALGGTNVAVDVRVGAAVGVGFTSVGVAAEDSVGMVVTCGVAELPEHPIKIRALNGPRNGFTRSLVYISYLTP